MSNLLGHYHDNVFHATNNSPSDKVKSSVSGVFFFFSLASVPYLEFISVPQAVYQETCRVPILYISWPPRLSMELLIYDQESRLLGLIIRNFLFERFQRVISWKVSPILVLEAHWKWQWEFFIFFFSNLSVLGMVKRVEW